MNVKDFIIAVGIMFIWGVNFSVIKLGLNSLDPFMLSALRFLLCALPLVFFIKKPDVPLIYIISYGLFFGVGLWGLVSLGIYFGISAGVASLVLQMGAFFTVIMAHYSLKEHMDLSKKLGILLAFMGIVLIISVTDGSVTYLGIALILIAAVFMAATNIIVKKAKPKKVFAFFVWSSLFSPIPLFIIAYMTQGDIVFINFFESLDQNAIFSILFQVYPTSLLGYWVWNSLLNKYPASSVAPLGLLVPIFGLLGSYLLFNEEIGLNKLLACALIIAGLAVNTFGSKIFNLKAKV
ncbi:MAG: EamA family transporter [Campylobacteraceae bacterium]|nr:EamA family transporter [Campylobacteraceae bacterium]